MCNTLFPALARVPAARVRLGRCCREVPGVLRSIFHKISAKSLGMPKSQISTMEDAGGQESATWMPQGDQKEKESFMLELTRLKLPFPQRPGDWHAARVYIDSLNKSIYDVEQWCDYLRIKGKLPLLARESEPVETKNAIRSPLSEPSARSLTSRRRNSAPPLPRGPKPSNVRKTAHLQRSVSILFEMGFKDISQTTDVLVACGGNFESALNALLSSSSSSSSTTSARQTTSASTSESKFTTLRTPNHSVSVQCPRCRSILRLPSSAHTFACVRCGTKSFVTRMRPCMACRTQLRYFTRDPIVRCPRCLVQINTRQWTTCVTRPNSCRRASLQRMAEMGLVNEARNARALDVSMGDLSRAIEIVLETEGQVLTNSDRKWSSSDDRSITRHRTASI